ncbi:MAG: hypothetical protein WBE69_17470, partial [Candidatus Binataceae bacterium]
MKSTVLIAALGEADGDTHAAAGDGLGAAVGTGGGVRVGNAVGAARHYCLHRIPRPAGPAPQMPDMHGAPHSA